jgi:hypothetical protein
VTPTAVCAAVGPGIVDAGRAGRAKQTAVATAVDDQVTAAEAELDPGTYPIGVTVGKARLDTLPIAAAVISGRVACG